MGKNKTVRRFAIGTVVAAAAGYVAGILTAPKSGKETRADIKEASIQGKREAEKQLKKLHTQLNALLAEAKGQATELQGRARKDFDSSMQRGKAAREKARQLLSALHEGDADDKDLQSAIKEGQAALQHLKSYFKKEA
ncbi:MAG TPA: YtxH domain-containing protein [Candidatus Saccharimonadales bacterium]|nr:YtxH domain-containing protein [Candidatus Saccharimonadales bacterium]